MANNELNTPPAVVLLSGGLDSATTLAIARDQGFACHAIAFDYGQRHRAELDASLRQAKALGALSHRVVHVDMNQFGGSALTDFSIEVPEAHSQAGIPSTYVPARNTVMLSLALALAETLNSRDIFLGVNAVDYSGYPDCRDDTLKALQVALSLGLDTRLVLETPLMWLDKAQTWKMAESLGGPALVALIEEETHTCYVGDRTHRHAWGYGCNTCPACDLRRTGHERYIKPSAQAGV